MRVRFVWSVCVCVCCMTAEMGHALLPARRELVRCRDELALQEALRVDELARAGCPAIVCQRLLLLCMRRTFHTWRVWINAGA
jgi:hypothetical protein